MNDESINVLLIEANPGDAQQVRKMLTDAGGSFRLAQAERLPEGVAHLSENGTDVVLLDLGQPDCQGLYTLALARAAAPATPVVVLGDIDDEAIAVEAARAGAQDYLVKGQFDADLLARSFRCAIGRKRAEEAVRVSEARYRSIVQRDSESVVVVNARGTVQFANPAAEALLGQPSARLVGAPFGFAVGDAGPVEVDIVQGNGRAHEIVAEMRVAEIEWEGEPGYLVSLRDITERARKARLIRAQRDLAVALGATSSLDEGVRLCLETAIAISGLDCGGFYLVAEDSGAFDLAYHQALPPAYVVSRSLIDAGSDQAKLIMAGAPIYAEHLAQGEPPPGAAEREGLRAIAIIPLRYQDRVIGCLSIASYVRDEVPRSARDALEAIASQIGGPIARLQAEALASTREATGHGQRLLMALGQAAQAVQRARTPEEVYRTVGHEVVNLGFHVVMFRLTPDGKNLTVDHQTFEPNLLRTAERLLGVSTKDFVLTIDPGGFFDEVLSQGRTVLVRRIVERIGGSMPKAARPVAGTLLRLLGLREAIYAPLTVGGETHGLMLVMGTGVTEVDVPAVTAFANQTAIALENTLLYQEVQQYAAGLEQRVAERTRELEEARAAAFSLMEDAHRARRTAENANEELKAEVRARQRIQEELARSNQELEQFAYVASHDLQEPLRKVQAFGDRLAARYADALDERGHDYLERMQDAARRMQIMIQDLLVFSRVSTRAQPFSPVDLHRLAQEAVSDLEIRIEKTGGRVEIGKLPTIEADPTQMRQLLENLIGNGLKFHREGVAPQVKVTARLAAEAQGEVCHLLVRDNGIGFDEKYLDRIFEPFQRLHGRGTYEGTGIGLAICRKIAERHGGSITAQSAPDRGATFIVTLPIAQTKEETKG